MKTRVLQVDPALPSAAAIREAARVLRDGGTVAFPTETVYGLGALADDARCVARIFAAKERPSYNPLIAHVPDLAAARALSSAWPPLADSLAATFWPGPLTVVVPRDPSRIPDIVSAGLPSVAIRAPAHPVALALLRELGRPVAAPSANRFQSLSPTTASHVLKSLDGRIDLVLDAGPCAFGIESTVVDLTADPPMILRPGALSLGRLQAVAPTLTSAPALPLRDDDGTPRASPGMLQRHYAPRAALSLTSDAELLVRARQATRSRPLGVIALRPMPELGALHDVHPMALGESPELYARNLFAALHALDDLGCAVILAAPLPSSADWDAVRDRLARAAA